MILPVTTDGAPAAFGPYSQAIDTGSALFISGQLGVDPKTGEMPQSCEDQARLVMQNLKSILAQAGLTFSNVVKTTIFLTDLANFNAVNDIYGDSFPDHKPARSCIQVTALPKGGKIEIELIAVK